MARLLPTTTNSNVRSSMITDHKITYEQGSPITTKEEIKNTVTLWKMT